MNGLVSSSIKPVGFLNLKFPSVTSLIISKIKARASSRSRVFCVNAVLYKLKSNKMIVLLGLMSTDFIVDTEYCTR